MALKAQILLQITNFSSILPRRVLKTTDHIRKYNSMNNYTHLSNHTSNWFQALKSPEGDPSSTFFVQVQIGKTESFLPSVAIRKRSNDTTHQPSRPAATNHRKKLACALRCIAIALAFTFTTPFPWLPSTSLSLSNGSD